MSNPNVFTFNVGEKVCYADPLKVRRVLLQQTMGKCWGLVRKINRTKELIDEFRKKAANLEKDLEVNPTTPEEMGKIQELQQLRAENKQPTLPFDQLPRAFQLDGYEGHVAVYCREAAELEGVLANASYQAFDLPPLDLEKGEGVSETEVLAIFKTFLEYAEGKGERLGS